MSIYLDEIVEGDTFTSAARTVTADDIARFAELSGDFNPLHVDRDWVRANTGFDDCIAHGLLMLSITSGLATPDLDDWALEAYLHVDRRMVGPTYAGDTVHARWTVVSARPSKSRPTSGIVTVEVDLVNQRDEVVQTGRDTYLVRARAADSSHTLAD